MNYITTAERIGIEKGRQEGEIAFLTRLLIHRFCHVPDRYLAAIQQANNDTLLLWGERVLDAATLEEVFE